MQFFKTFILLALISVFTSCDVEPVDSVLANEINDPNNPNNPIPSVEDYLPRAVNNTWNYQYNISETSQIKILSIETINGIPFYKFNRFFSDDIFGNSNSTSYVARVGDSYIYRNASQFEGIPGTDPATIVMQYSLLKSNLNVGQTWNDNQSFTLNVMGVSMTYQIQIQGKILEKGTSVTLGSTTYNDVIKTELTINVQGVEIVSYYWFAKNVGIIKAVEAEDLQNQVDGFELTSFQLN